MGFQLDENLKPIYTNDIADPVGQLQAAVDYPGNELTGAVEKYTDLPKTSNWVGRHRYVTGERSWYTWAGVSVGWIPDTNEKQTPFSFTGIYTNANSTFEPVKAVEQGGRVQLEGMVSNNTFAQFVAATVYTLGSIPAALAPAKIQVFAATWGGTGLASIYVNPSGTVTYQVSTSASNVPVGGFLLSLAGISWRVKRG